MKQQTQILVDHRERSSPVPETLVRDHGLEVTYSQLSVGDYKVGDELIFERKTMLDFVASIIDGRLFRQACALVRADAEPVLILEGTSSDLSATQFTREAMQGALISISLTFGIPVLRSFDPNETGRLIAYAIKQSWSFPKRGHYRTSYRGISRNRRRLRAQLSLLQGLPGIGPVRGKALLESFGTVEAVLTASADRLCQIRGIGPDTANLIRWVVGP
jgi:ERCC4-type nuclease